MYDNLPAPVGLTVDRRSREQLVAELELCATRQARYRESLESVMQERNAARAEISDPADERLAPIWELAARAADENGFCPEYDKLCDSLGVPGRPRLRRGIVRVEFNLYAYAMATADDDAAEAMEERVRGLIQSFRDEHIATPYESREDGDLTHLDVDRIDAEDVSVYE